MRHCVLPVVDGVVTMDITELVHERTSVPVDAFFLVKEVRQVETGKSLLDEGVKRNDTVHMCGRFAGFHCFALLSIVPLFSIDFVNNCEHQLVELVLCVFGTCRAFVVPAEVFHTWCSYADFFSCAGVCFSQGP